MSENGNLTCIVNDNINDIINDNNINEKNENNDKSNGSFHKDYRINNASPDWGITQTLQSSLNLRIGTQAWKKYISAAFWNYISTPINFTITLFTALTAGQTGTQTTYLTEKQLFIMLFVSFLLSIINTFFKLKEKAVLNYDASKKYDEFGATFESIYYMPLSSEKDLQIKLVKYKMLQEEINKYSQKESIENVNYFTELIYLCFRCLFEDRLKRINKSDRYWYLDGLSQIDDRTKNQWTIDINKYFLYDPSGQPIILDDEEMKEKNKDKSSNNNFHKKYRNSRLQQQLEMNIENEKNEFLKGKLLLVDTKKREEERLENIKKEYLKEQFQKEMIKCYIKKINTDESRDNIITEIEKNVNNV
jgi:hypothetical protein